MRNYQKKNQNQVLPGFILTDYIYADSNLEPLCFPILPGYSLGPAPSKDECKPILFLFENTKST